MSEIESMEIAKWYFDAIKDNLNKNIKETKDNPELLLNDTKDFKLPLIVDEIFSKYIQKFMHSFRNKDQPTININNKLRV